MVPGPFAAPGPRERARTLRSGSRTTRWLVLAGVLLLVGPASAAPITVGFSGVIDSVTDLSPPILPAFSVGDPFAGTYTLDPDLFTGRFTVSDFGTVYHSGGPGTLAVDVGATRLSKPVVSIGITNGEESVLAGTPDGWGVPGLFLATSALEFSVTFRDSTQTRVARAGDFFVNDSLAGWDTAELSFFTAVGQTTRVVATGAVTDVFVVPEPGTPMLIGFGLVWLSLRRR